MEDQIDQEWNKLEPVIEQYNNVHNKLKANRAQVAQIQKRLTPLEVEVNVAMAQVRGMAADAYKQGSPGAMRAMLMTGSATGLTEKLTFLDQYARHQRNEVSDVAEAPRPARRGQAATWTCSPRSLAGQDAQLAQSKAAIEKKIDELQKLRIKAYGASGGNDGALRTGPCPVTYTNDKGGRAAQKACSLIGKPYVFGAEGPNGYDCSGLTKEAWAQRRGPPRALHPRPVGRGPAGEPAPSCDPATWSSTTPDAAPHGASTSAAARWCTPRTPATTCGWPPSTAAPVAGYRRPG